MVVKSGSPTPKGIKLYYQPTVHSRKPVIPKDLPPPYLLLTKNEWNDYGYETTFDLFHVGTESHELIGELSLVAEGYSKTRDAIEEGKFFEQETVEFAIKGHYISLPRYLSFYENLRQKLDEGQFYEALKALHDVNFLEHKERDIEDLALRASECFQTSALRESNALDVFGGGKQKVFPEDFIPTRFDFTISAQVGRCDNDVSLEIRFTPESGLPGDIFVLIGKNGLGKTQFLYRILNSVAGSGAGLTYIDVTNRGRVFPPFEKIVALALSPFEQFPITIEETQIRYEYGGCRNEDGFFDIAKAEDGLGAKLKKIIDQDIHEAKHMGAKARPKLATLIRSLKDGLEIQNFNLTVKKQDGTEFILSNLLINRHTADQINEQVDFGARPVILLNGVKYADLSAGQKMFLLTAINLVSSISSSSLILVDEPELYLHPNLECSFMNMFRTILRSFESRAIIATHSVFLARETPSSNLVILREAQGELVLTKPGFEIFGADIGLIADFIFENNEQGKHYEEWLRGLVRSGLSLNQIREKYKSSINIDALAILRDEEATTGAS